MLKATMITQTVIKPLLLFSLNPFDVKSTTDNKFLKTTTIPLEINKTKKMQGMYIPRYII